MTTPLWSLGVAQLESLYRGGAVSPVEVTRAVLDRVAQVQPVVNAVVASDAGAALDAARASERRWRQRRPASVLDGIPLTVKDNIPAVGLPCTWGSRLYQHHRPLADEAPVAALRAAGAVIVGKTNVPEFTLHGYTGNALFGETGNPWAPALTPGGSSGGAVAAVACGIGALALATDGGGSIRRPAGHTGLVGLKPTMGRVPRADGLPALLLDYEVIGPIARRVQDVALAMGLLAPGFEARDQVERLRILRVRRVAGSPVDPVIDAAMDTVAARLSDLGHTVGEAADLPLADIVNREVWPVLSASGVAWLLRQFADAQARVSPAIAALAEQGRAYTAADLMQALNRAHDARSQLHHLQRDWDLLLTPSAAAMPWPADRTHPDTIDGQAVGPRGHAVFTAFVNATGMPAIALPAPRSPQGLPIGFQLVGRHGDDELLCAVGAEYEAVWPWAQDWPPLPA